MARPSKAEVARKQKDAKQKKLLFVLIPVFLLLVVWQGPKMFKMFSGSGQEATPAPVTTTAPVPAAPGTPPPAETSTTAATPPPAGLADTDVPPAAGTARLVSFSRFGSRDPFGSHASTGGETEAPEIPGSTPDEGAAAGAAVIEVNGTSETVSPNGEFPAGDPTFRLVSLTADGAEIGLVSGSFEGAEETVTLTVGEEIELVADPDGTRYTVTLVSID
ncbi:MAG TPA: hypothetical protein VE644_04655 [Gaiellaceae bacterium]|jgi:hypothetical protein|nr:hypothetical protein [Gaiellaceae bacterium]